MADVTRIEFVIYAGGRKLEAIFVRQEKIADLLSATGSLGEFLQDAGRLAAQGPPSESGPDPDLEKSSPAGFDDRELPDDTSEFDALWDLPPFTKAVAELSKKLGGVPKDGVSDFLGGTYVSLLRGLPLALALLLVVANTALDDGQDEFEVLKAARAAFKRAREQRQGSGH